MGYYGRIPIKVPPPRCWPRTASFVNVEMPKRGCPRQASRFCLLDENGVWRIIGDELFDFCLFPIYSAIPIPGDDFKQRADRGAHGKAAVEWKNAGNFRKDVSWAAENWHNSFE